MKTDLEIRKYPELTLLYHPAELPGCHAASIIVTKDYEVCYDLATNGQLEIFQSKCSAVRHSLREAPTGRLTPEGTSNS